MLAVEGIDPGFVAMACRRYVQGQVPNANHTWRPTPAELASEARRLRDAARETERIAALPYAPERPRLTGPRKPFTPYPKLWEALANEPDMLAALQSLEFDGMTKMSRTFATEGIDAVRRDLRPIASAPRQKAERAA